MWLKSRIWVRDPAAIITCQRSRLFLNFFFIYLLTILLGSVVSLVSVVSFRSFRSFRWFRLGGFVSLFRVLVRAVLRYMEANGMTNERIESPPASELDHLLSTFFLNTRNFRFSARYTAILN